MSKYNNIVVLTGSGISQESGIPTFRGNDGLWEGYPLEQVATPEAFEEDPDLVYEFYNMRRQKTQDSTVKPNAAHLCLAEFQQNFPDKISIVTQNVDDLHERAGATRVLHMHGELLKVRCTKTDEVFHWTGKLDKNSVNPKDASLVGTLRPHIVWFGEIPLHMEEIERLLAKCDLFMAIGTSGQVYPAAGFVNWVPPSCYKVELNKDDTPVAPYFDEKIRGKASEIVPDFFSRIS